MKLKSQKHYQSNNSIFRNNEDNPIFNAFYRRFYRGSE